MSPTPPTPTADTQRREQITRRIASLRTLGTAGAIAALGIFTGLSATNGLSCSEPATATSCLNQANFASLTTNGWTFTGSVWRKTFAINSTASGEYLHYARNTQDQSSAIPVLLTITP